MNVPIDLSGGWLFRRGWTGRSWMKGADAQGSLPVDLPHSWNLDDTFQENVEYYRGRGAYRRTFVLPAEACGRDRDGTWILESEGFYGTGDVWLNGRKVAEVDGEYLGFCLDVGQFVRPGENLLGVRLTNRCRSYVLPGIKLPDFLLHGGLAGKVLLRREPAVHLERNSMGMVVSGIPGPRAVVTVSAQVHNTCVSDGPVVLWWTILDPSGREVCSTTTQPASVPVRAILEPAEMRVEIPGPELWSPATPSLYVARCELLRGDSVVDRFEKRFGLRSAVFEAGKGFLLNGERIELRGCNRHESMPGFGSALPVALHKEDARLLKETGCNIVRLSHYPQHPAFLDACDEMGLMVYAEIATWKSVRTGRWLRRALRQMERMILRDRHRPSVILWGLGNESRSRKAYLALGALARSLDPTRPVTYAENHLYRAVREKTLDIPDVWGCNYELDALADGCAASRLKTTLVTETGNMPTAARGNLAEELKQVKVIETDLARLEGKEFNSGCIVWCMNDYATLRKKRYLRYSGIFDAWRLPKMSRAFLRARWTDKPFIQVFGDWTVGKGVGEAGTSREIHVFSNCRRISLLRNGREIVSSGGKAHMVFHVEFQEGTLKALGRQDGHEVAHSLQTSGPASRLGLKGVEIEPRSGGQPLVAIEISVLDKAGVVCADWNGRVSVRVAGAARLCAFTADGSIPVLGGIGRTFAICTGGGAATVEAVCPPLAAGQAELNFA